MMLPPEEQYLVATGRNYFRDLAFADLRRAQIDLETTGLDPNRDRVFLIAARDPDGVARALESEGEGDRAEADLLLRLIAWVRASDPDVIENHNLHGFDLPFLAERSRRLGVPLALGRAGAPGLRRRPSARGASIGPGKVDRDEDDDPMRRARFTVPGRELGDTTSPRGISRATVSRSSRVISGSRASIAKRSRAETSPASGRPIRTACAATPSTT
jgi:DNA polymerase elongation subunit (family B)